MDHEIYEYFVNNPGQNLNSPGKINPHRFLEPNGSENNKQIDGKSVDKLQKGS